VPVLHTAFFVGELQSSEYVGSIHISEPIAVLNWKGTQ